MTLLLSSAFGTADRTASNRVHATNSAELQIALLLARPGQVIQLSDGVFRGVFVISVSGTAEQPITLSGSGATILDGGAHWLNYGLTLRADHWRVENLTVRNAKKGIVLHGASHNTLIDVRVENVGEEAIRLRNFSSHNTIERCAVARTGLLRPGYGEGIYIGSDHDSWRDNSGGRPDHSDNTRVLRCVFGPDVSAEHIDVKEGTSGGLIDGNVFNGAGISGENFADSLMDVKGNGYLIQNNRAVRARSNQLVDGIQVHRKLGEWGLRNVLRDNVLELDVPGYGFNVQMQESYDGGNRVEGSNVVAGAALGYSNIAAPSRMVAIGAAGP
jgi:hypothetical protein